MMTNPLRDVVRDYGSKGRVVFLLLALCCLYALAVLPYLDRFPVLDPAQAGIMAPAYKLATQGIYGNDLYRGLYHAETRNYEYMPLYALAVALSFKIFGYGIWQARLVSVLCGFAILILTFLLGKKLFNAWIGLSAAGILVLLPLAVSGYAAGALYPGRIPLLDFARVIRYDMMAAAWMLAASLAFITAHDVHTPPRKQFALLGLSGVFIGLATLSQLYGAFIFIFLGLLLLWQDGFSTLQFQKIALLLAGWFLALLPWLVYVFQDFSAYEGQMLRHQERFVLFNPVFYLDNVLREPWRYLKLFGSFRHPDLFPRPGLWLLVLTFIIAQWHLWPQIQKGVIQDFRKKGTGGGATRPFFSGLHFVWLSVPVLVGLLALLVSFKRYVYIILFLPFLAIQAAYGLYILLIEAQKRHRLLYWAMILFVSAAFVESLLAIRQTLLTAQDTPTLQEVIGPVKEIIPPDARFVMMHTFWPAFSAYDTYALDLVFNLSDPDLITAPPSMETVLIEIAPDYILVGQETLNAYKTDPASLPNAEVLSRWETFHQSLLQHCQSIWQGNTYELYGTPVLFQCKYP